MRWLWSPRAIEAHVVFLSAAGLLACSILCGDPGPTGDYPHGLLFLGAAYPVVLLLLWLKWRINGGGEC
jgi:hypothetical protein